ncbi:MAG: S41 family peptidase [Armatimonadetes bacterium]|nr:S41 family peptidase [Armatimonadota bacterium]
MTYSGSTQRRSARQVLLGIAGAVSLFAGGFALAPISPQEMQAATPSALQVAAAPGAQISLLGPLPEEKQATPLAEPGSPESRMLPVETYSRVLRKLKDSYYKDPGTDRELTYAAIRGMLASLGDRYTRFLDPDEFRRMQQENEGEFGGIGAKLEKVQGKTVIKEVVPNTPAQKGQLKAGDVILAVEDKNVVGQSLEKVVDQIRGQVGTPVKLLIERKGVAQPFTKSIVRNVIKLPTVEAEMLLDAKKKPTGVAKIQLLQFNQHAHEELDQALRAMQKKGMKALIFDLRGNPGGYLSEAVEVASRFLNSGPVVYIQRGSKKEPMNVVRDRTIPKVRVPYVILVNKGSASASEIVAGAVKDTKSGILVGTDTWGKGLVQTINPIRNDGSAVLITTHKYLTPSGTDINKKGIAPHWRVEMTPEDVEKKRDPQQDKALAILKNEIDAVATRRTR